MLIAKHDISIKHTLFGCIYKMHLYVYVWLYNPYVVTFLFFSFDPKDKMAKYTGAGLLEVLMNS